MVPCWDLKWHPLRGGDARGELLKGSKAVLEQFQRDGGRRERRH